MPLLPPALGPTRTIAVPPPTSGGGRSFLPAHMEHQTEGTSLWCWAHVASCISHIYCEVSGVGSPFSPCEVASRCCGPAYCPAPTDHSDKRNKEWGIEDALLQIGHPGEPLFRALNFHDVTEQINLKQPICCRIVWDRGCDVDGAHYVLITGYDGQDVYVCDSRFGDHQFPFSDFRTRYQPTAAIHGTWNQTYLTT